MDYSKLCTPALIYFIISFVYLLIYSLSNFSISSIIINTIVIILWSLLLNFLCSNGFPIVAWVLLLFPFLFYIR